MISKTAFCFLSILIYSGLSFGQAVESERKIPPMDPELLTGPEQAARESERLEKLAKVNELRGERSRIEAEIKRSRDGGQSTDQLEAELARVETRLLSIKKPAPWDPITLAWPALHAKMGEINQTISKPEPLSVEDASRLLDALYTNIHPRLNCNLQHFVLHKIQVSSNQEQLTDESRHVLRNGVLDYYHATKDQCDDKRMGPMCSPISTMFLAQTISTIADPDDAEAREAFKQLQSRTQEICKAFQLEREGGIAEGLLAIAEEAFDFQNEDMHGITRLSGNITLGEGSIDKILRTYKKILRAPPRRVKLDIISVIDVNLLLLAQRDLSNRNWGLWSDATIALGYQRASPTLRAFISNPKHNKDEAKGVKSKELARVDRVFSRYAQKS